MPWAHLDIAGPARAAETEHYVAKGGTGFGVRTLVELARAAWADGQRPSGATSAPTAATMRAKATPSPTRNDRPTRCEAVPRHHEDGRRGGAEPTEPRHRQLPGGAQRDQHLLHEQRGRGDHDPGDGEGGQSR